jgi:hypothetical protein
VPYYLSLEQMLARVQDVSAYQRGLCRRRAQKKYREKKLQEVDNYKQQVGAADRTRCISLGECNCVSEAQCASHTLSQA